MTPPAGTTREETRLELTELIAALDRRLPQVQRIGEAAIASAATALRAEALRRLGEIDREIADRAPQLA